MSENITENNLRAKKQIKITKIIVVLFILAGMIIGYLNSVLSPRLPEQNQVIIHFSYQVFENIIRTIMVLIGGY